MKSSLLCFFLTFSSLAFNQSFNIFEIKTPIDSAGYIALFNENAVRKSKWQKWDTLQFSNFSATHLFKKNNRWGIANNDLEIMLSPVFGKADFFENQYFLLHKSTLLVLNEELDTLQQVNDCYDYQFATNNSGNKSAKEATAIIKTRKGCGILGGDGNWLAPISSYSDAFFLNNFIYTKKNNLFGCFYQLKELIPPEYKAIQQFSPNLFRVTNTDGTDRYYHLSGKLLPKSDSTLIFYKDFFKIYQNGKGELYSFKGNKVVRYQGDDIYNINDALNKNYYAVRRGDKIGVVNQYGKVIIPFQYDHIECGGRDQFIVQKEDYFGVISRNNKTILPFEYTFIQPLTKNETVYYRVTRQHLKGITNTKGEVLIPTNYHAVEQCRLGFLIKKNNLLGVADDNGNIITPPFKQYYCITNSVDLLLFWDNTGECLVNNKEIITPVNANKMIVKRDWVKYYLDDRIVMHQMEAGVIKDTTVYPSVPSVQVKRREHNRKISIYEDDFTLFVNQKTGKLGSLAKRSGKWKIKPNYNNIIHQYSTFVRIAQPDTIKIENLIIPTAQHVLHFSPSSGSISQPLKGVAYSHFSQRSFHHSTSTTPAYSTDDKWNYITNHTGINHNFILPISGYLSAELLSGELNFQEGDELMDFKTFYNNLNGAYNLTINDKTIFRLLSQNPMIYVKNPLWNVYTQVKKSASRKSIGRYKGFKQLDYESVILKNQNNLYDLYSGEAQDYLATNCIKITPVQAAYISYYIIKKYGDKGKVVCNVYGSGGIPVFDRNFDEVEVLGPDVFKVTYEGNEFITNADESVFYLEKETSSSQ